MDGAADLSRLADIVVPPPVPWWPPAPGWWILAAALLVALVILLVAAIRRWKADAYRRAALAELDRMGSVGDTASVAAVSEVLKRTALAVYPRRDVAALTGPAWLVFLDRTGGLSDDAGLAGAAYGAGTGDGAALLAAARRWVKRHRAER